MSVSQCITCGNYSRLDDDIAGFAWECWCCQEPHWISENHMFDYMELNNYNAWEAFEDLQNRIPYFVHAHYQDYLDG